MGRLYDEWKKFKEKLKPVGDGFYDLRLIATDIQENTNPDPLGLNLKPEEKEVLRKNHKRKKVMTKKVKEKEFDPFVGL